MKDHPELLWKDGKPFCCTFSWDDGHVFDRRVVDTMNRFGCKGTFNLNSGLLDHSEGPRPHLASNEVASLFQGQEVAFHSVSHPWPSQLPSQIWLKEVLDDKARLEDLVQYPIRGGAWPFGDFNDSAIEVLKHCGIEYCRSVSGTGRFKVPETGTWETWNPTCHHSEDSDKKWQQMIKRRPGGLFYVWSHGFEMEEQNQWSWLESFCKMVGEDDRVWHATNIEIKDTVDAFRRLAFSSDGRWVTNPSSTEVWLKIGSAVIPCAPGETTSLASDSSILASN